MSYRETRIISPYKILYTIKVSSLQANYSGTAKSSRRYSLHASTFILLTIFEKCRNVDPFKQLVQLHSNGVVHLLKYNKKETITIRTIAVLTHFSP